MACSVQVAYPTAGGTKFDFDYYGQKHGPLVAKLLGNALSQKQICRGLSGFGDAPAPFHAIATLVFADRAAMERAMPELAQLRDDIGNFYNGDPMVVVGEVL